VAESKLKLVLVLKYALKIRAYVILNGKKSNSRKIFFLLSRSDHVHFFKTLSQACFHKFTFSKFVDVQQKVMEYKNVTFFQNMIKYNFKPHWKQEINKLSAPFHTAMLVNTIVLRMKFHLIFLDATKRYKLK